MTACGLQTAPRLEPKLRKFAQEETLEIEKLFVKTEKRAGSLNRRSLKITAYLFESSHG